MFMKSILHAGGNAMSNIFDWGLKLVLCDAICSSNGHVIAITLTTSEAYIDGLVQDCSNSIANALE